MARLDHFSDKSNNFKLKIYEKESSFIFSRTRESNGSCRAKHEDSVVDVVADKNKENSEPSIGGPVKCSTAIDYKNFTRTEKIVVDCDEPAHDVAPSTSLRDFFTLIALTFHSLFEGLAVGLGNSGHDVWKLFIGE